MPVTAARWLAAAVVSALFAWALLAALLDLTAAQTYSGPKVDAVVVAGCRVDPGGVPSPCLAARVDRGVALYEAGVAPLLVFTGGVGDNPPSEAAVAADRARSLGVPAAAIHTEERSTSTEENARYAATLTNPNGQRLERVVVVSDTWHTHRVARVFRRYFPTVATVGVHSPTGPRVLGALREVLALVYYAALGRLAPPEPPLSGS